MVRRGVDTNVLVYAHVPSSIAHEPVNAYLEHQLNDAETVLVVTPAVLAEFVHVVTDARRHRAAAPMAEALAIARGYVGRRNVECVAIDETTLALGLDLLRRHRLGRDRVADTMLAGTLLRHGVDELITCDPDDFGVFDGLSVIDPRG